MLSSGFCRFSLRLDRHIERLPNTEPNSHNNMLARLNPAAAVMVAVGPSKYLPRNAPTTPVQASVSTHCQIKIPRSQSRLENGKQMSIAKSVAVIADRPPAAIA